MKRAFLFIFLLLPFVILKGQRSPSSDSIITQLGLRFAYGLELQAKNYIGVHEYYLFEAGHRFSYGAFLNTGEKNGIQFNPFFGFEHVFWPKSQAYTGDCTVDSFPTYYAIDDSLPGRDFRLVNVVFEPALKIYSNRLKLFLKFQPSFSYTFQTKVENYVHTCAVPVSQGWISYENGALRHQSKFNFGIGGGIVKEIWINERAGFSIEPGVRMIFTQNLKVRHPDPDGPSFSLYPRGYYINLSFFR